MNPSPAATPPRDIAIFDLDHTLTRRDTYLRFLLSVLKRRPWRLGHCVLLPAAVVIHKSGLRDNTWLKRVFLRAIAGGATRADLSSMARDFSAQTLQTQIYPDARACVERHVAAGDRLVLASASFDLYVPLIGAALGFEHVLCTRAAWGSDDRLSGDIEGHNCYGPHKLTAVQTLLDNLPERGHVTMYSDHHSDLPVLRLADTGVAVNPTPKLAAAASVHGLVTEHWR